MDELQNPNQVARKYIEASLKKDLVKISYYETGDEDAFQKKYGVLSQLIIKQIKKESQIKRPDDYKWIIKSEDLEELRANFTVEFTYPNSGILSNLELEYLGFAYIDGKIVKKDISGLSSEEAKKSARSDSRLKFETQVVPLRLKRISMGWIISEDNKEFHCFVLPKDGCE